MLFPNDARNNTAISKAVASFGLLRYWHDTSNNARILVKVHQNDDTKIPHDVVVSAGLPPRARSWTCPAFVLKRKGVTKLGDEDQFQPVGPLHPLPVDAPRWMGMQHVPQVAHSSQAGSVVGGPAAFGPTNAHMGEDLLAAGTGSVTSSRSSEEAPAGFFVDDSAAFGPTDAHLEVLPAVGTDVVSPSGPSEEALATHLSMALAIIPPASHVISLTTPEV
ncbi:hypothetical protein BAE44_0019540 [Dichanthelium oligosanthes]|uniref:Uncharacterized protein n=1 Tax=Dichanthelium oligosanthes TaxID=888268 RepID=A0A1E5V2U9_9POAL|nr:hypothetical protein BAE44_0019540 [Dichanthelium oligosanthes]